MYIKSVRIFHAQTPLYEPMFTPLGTMLSMLRRHGLERPVQAPAL